MWNNEKKYNTKANEKKEMVISICVSIICMCEIMKIIMKNNILIIK